MARGWILIREVGLETYNWESRVTLKEGPPPAQLTDDLAPGRTGTHH
jgi:hypothetical protein